MDPHGDTHINACGAWHTSKRGSPKDECLRNATFVKTFAKRFGIGQWSSIGPNSEKKWYPSENKSTRSLGPCCGRYVTEIRRKRTSHLPCNDSIVQTKIEKQRKRDTVHTLHCWSRYNWYNLSHYSLCQSAQYLRGSGSHMRRIWTPARWHGGTRNTGGSINCSQRS